MSTILLNKEELIVSGPEVEKVNKTLKLFSERNKLKILLLLYCNGPLPVCVMSKALGLDQTLAPHRLKVLKASGLVEYEKVAKHRLYTLTNYTAIITHTRVVLDLSF
uniref:ArsR family transcriptional regulator n=1 Tax=Ignisphaera aggregans TaxID=334771 RepID=A0A7J2TAT2_9CREN